MNEVEKIDIHERIAIVESSLKSAHKRIDEVKTLTESVYELASSIKEMKGDISDVSSRLRAVEDKPAKRWDLVVTTIISAIVGYLIKGFLL